MSKGVEGCDPSTVCPAPIAHPQKPKTELSPDVRRPYLVCDAGCGTAQRPTSVSNDLIDWRLVSAQGREPLANGAYWNRVRFYVDPSVSACSQFGVKNQLS